MNVEISEKVIEDSIKIDAGIRILQSKMTDVIDRFTEKNGDPKVLLQKYNREVAGIKADLQDILRQQKEFDRTVQSAEKEIAAMSSDLKKMIAQNHINISESNVKENISQE